MAARPTWRIDRPYDGRVKRPLSEAWPEIYEVLRALAARRLRPGDPADPTSLVHEAWLKLDAARFDADGPEHLRAVAAMAIRQVLVDRFRRSNAARRRGEAVTLTRVPALGRDVDAEALDDAITDLEAIDPRGAAGVVLRFFGGMTAAEIATVQATSISTVEADWRRSRAWLAARLR
jgi:RNA polymerase sigma factor (TIGR02999 family)